MKFKIKYADQIVGLFIVIALAAFCAIVILLGVNQRWFAKDYRFRTNFPSGAGVGPGTSILMKGFTIGKIDKLTLNEGNTVDAQFHIFDSYYDKVNENSLLELSVSPIGLGSQLLFHPGRSDVRVAEGQYIPTTDSPEGIAIIEQELVDIPPKDDTINRLLANVNPLLENVNKTVVTVNRTLTEINRALAGQSAGPLGDIVNDASAAAGKLPATMENVDGLVSDLRGRTDTILASVTTITENLAQTTEAIKDPTGLVPRLLDAKGSLKTLLDDKNVLYNRIIAMAGDLEKSVKSIQTIMAGLSSEMPKIALILNESKTAIQKAQDVLEGVKNNPLLKGGIPERKEQQSLYQGMREGSFE